MRKEITANWSLINKLASRRFATTALAEEAALFVLNGLEENDCRRLRKFSGKAKLSTFIASVSLRLLEDFSRKKFGRIRPPGWLKALGGLWSILFNLLCLERFRVDDAVETVLSRKQSWQREEIETAAWQILERITSCGKHQGLEVSIDDAGDDENNPEVITSDLMGPEEQLLANERRIFFQLLFHETVENNHEITEADQYFDTRVLAEIAANTDDRLLLKLCYKDGFTVAKAGNMLGLNANQAHGRLRRVLERLRQELERIGMSDALRELLQDG